MRQILYYSSYSLNNTWIAGIFIFFLTIATAFLGYVLPWGQMSFWGATVITILISAIPYIGYNIVLWIWGGFAIDNATLTRFYSLHFILPFIILIIVIVHLLFLHQTGSNNPLGTNRNIDKISFHPFFSWKDILGFNIAIFILLILILSFMTVLIPLLTRVIQHLSLYSVSNLMSFNLLTSVATLVQNAFST